jgi:hypothetical protein
MGSKKVIFGHFPTFRHYSDTNRCSFPSIFPHEPTTTTNRHTPFILQQIITWLYTGKLSVHHEVQLDTDKNSLVDESPFLTEIAAFAKKYGSFTLGKLAEVLMEHNKADLEQMNSERSRIMRSKFDDENGQNLTRERNTFDGLSLHQRFAYIFSRKDQEIGNAQETSLLQRFSKNERDCGRDFDVSIFKSNK